MTNSSAAVWTNITVASPGQGSVSGHAFVPQTREQFSYDADGNLTQDGHWNYGWDAENRLVALTNRAAAAPAQVLHFEYDPQSRRIHKQVWSNSNGSGIPATDLRFAYDGWNLLGILNSSLSLRTSFLWGLDLSGSLQGAGGVGGLLAVNDSASGAYFPAFDGNGNLTTLVKAADGSASAQYEYGPFGEVIRMTGVMAGANPFRFSTKYTDDESDVVYYGYRYFNPSTGRWISRDPAGDRDGNLYGFVNNNSLSGYDVLGLWVKDVHHDKTIEWSKAVGIRWSEAENIGIHDWGIDTLYPVYTLEASASPVTINDAN